MKMKAVKFSIPHVIHDRNVEVSDYYDMANKFCQDFLF